MDFNEVIKKRASIRKYSEQKPAEEKIIELIESANRAPSPGNLQILKYIIVEDSDKINKIAEACQQEFIKQSQILVVVCSDAKKIEIMYDKRAQKYIKHHTGAAIENFLLKITDLGLASCWVGAFSDLMIKDILKIPDEIEIEAILPVAYQSKIDKTTQRTKSEIFERVYFEIWKNKTKKPI